jgi:hypothetical protein
VLQGAGPLLEAPGRGGPDRAGLDRVKVDVLDRRWLPGKPGLVKIRDIAAIIVKQVENCERNVQ